MTCNEGDLYSDCNAFLLLKKLFSQICGAVAQCSHLNLDILNPAFVKYLVLHHDIQLESLTSRTIRFCCSLFHHTLQKLVTSEKDRLPSISATPIHCQSELCGEEAVGCLFHSKSEFLSSEEYDEEDGDDGQGELTVRRQKAKQNDDEEESYCVYRHLNDEMYRYCLLVHQKKDGDR
ncbi:unnamed protein product [Heligmosomoides polygyrus]|uniref:Uncharacterized protein n=1 Tax=Heligmosomoides polygyrus TaxID=6339 RepID=A0A183F562_HELPZ|nr:unnamed protein product [Heligmosomoides polygyrus]